MSYPCFVCKSVDVQEEFGRCPSCETSHQKLCRELDSKPRVKEKRVREELFPVVEVKNGIKVTTYIDRNDAAIMGIKV